MQKRCRIPHRYQRIAQFMSKDCKKGCLATLSLLGRIL